MKIFTFFASFFFTVALLGQTVDCSDVGAGITSFEQIECTDDYITFVVTTTGGNSRTGQFQNVPPNSFIDRVGAGFPRKWEDDPFFSVQSGEDYIFNMPSAGCLPLTLNFTVGFYANLSEGCSNEVTINNNIAPIPVLGQWALIILAFIFTIFGVIQIRRRVAIG